MWLKQLPQPFEAQGHYICDINEPIKTQFRGNWKERRVFRTEPTECSTLQGMWLLQRQSIMPKIIVVHMWRNSYYHSDTTHLDESYF